MLKNADKKETNSHFTYNEYRKKVKKGPNKDVLTFVSVFLVGLIILLGFAKILSPNVDVAINVDSDVVTEEDEARMSAIDERLLHLKMEDEGVQEDEGEIFSPELDEKVVLPSQRSKTVGEIEAEKVSNNLKTEDSSNVKDSVNVQKTQTPPVQKDVANEKTQVVATQQVAPTPAPVKPVYVRVVVGYYATEKQAEVAKSIIQDAGVGVNPIVKNIGGYYTLQVGSYSSKEAAQAAANSLLKANFPARIVE